MRITPSNFKDTSNVLVFELKSVNWEITYTNKISKGNGVNYINTKLVSGPKDKVGKQLLEVRRNLSDDTLTIII
jgi:hypothetical protein